MNSSILNILRGIGGEFEIIRTLGAFGVVVYIVSVPVFTGFMVFGQGKDFDLIAFCAAYPTGLGVAIGAIAGSNAIKDRNIAVAQVTAKTGSAPGVGPDAPGIVREVKVVNPESDPAHVQDAGSDKK